MIKKGLYITVLCIAAMGLKANAQPQENEVMTLHDCMAYAVSNSTKIRIQQAETGDAQVERREAILNLFTPQIVGQVNASYNFGRGIDPQTNTYTNTTSFRNNYGVQAGHDLFDGFQAVNNWKISKTGLLISESKEKQTEADICLAVMEAFYNVVYYKRLCDVYEEQVSISEQSLAKARRQEELGQKGHADVIEMEADLAGKQYDLTNAFNIYQDKKMILSDLMFWPTDEALEIDTSMPEWEAEPIATEEVVDFALQNDPAIKIASWQQLNAKRQLNTAKWQLMPTLSIYAGWSSSYYTYQGSSTATFGNQFKNNGGEYVELSLSIPIWNRFSRHSKISRQNNALERAQAELDQKRRDVESEVRRAVQDRDGAATAYRQAKRKSDVQTEAYSLNLKKLEQGLISPLEFQTADNNYRRAKADEMNSLFTYLIKQAVVRYYNGIEYINQ